MMGRFFGALAVVLGGSCFALVVVLIARVLTASAREPLLEVLSTLNVFVCASVAVVLGLCAIVCAVVALSDERGAQWLPVLGIVLALVGLMGVVYLPLVLLALFLRQAPVIV